MLTLIFLLGSCGGLSTRVHPPLVFAVNLSAQPVSLSLVEGSRVIVGFAELGAGESRALTRVEASEGATLQWGAGSSDVREVWTDPSGTPYSLRLSLGNIYAVVVDPDGSASLYPVPETYSTDPKVCVINATTQVMSQIQLAPDWGKNIKIYTQDVVPVVPSEFYSIPPKVLGLYWQTVAQVKGDRHSTVLGADGLPLRQTFETGRYYLFLAGQTDQPIRDLTPDAD